MSKNLMIGIIAIAVLIVGALFLYGNMTGNKTQTEEKNTTSTPGTKDTKPLGSSLESTDSSSTNQVKEFTVTGSNLKFEPSKIKVKKGDTVKIAFKNAAGFHNFVIDEFSVKTKQGNGPSEEIVTFVADNVGTYEFYCSVGNHRAMGMKGELIVQ